MLEANGIVTVCLSINREMSERVPAPRTVYVRFPHGAPFGEPHCPARHLQVLRDLLLAAQTVERPGTILDPGHRWRRPPARPPDPASFVAAGGGAVTPMG